MSTWCNFLLTLTGLDVCLGSVVDTTNLFFVKCKSVKPKTPENLNLGSPLTLCGLDVGLGCVVGHRYADDHIQGKQLVVEGALRLHVHLQAVSKGSDQSGIRSYRG